MGLELSFSTGLCSQVTNGDPRTRDGLFINQRSLWRLPPERWPSDRAVSIHAETASFPSFSWSAFNLIPSVVQKKVPSQLLHVSHYVPRLFLQHVSKPRKERSSPTVVSDLDQMRIGSHNFIFNLRIDRFSLRTFALIVDRFGGVIPNHQTDLVIEVRGQSSLTLHACKQENQIPSIHKRWTFYWFKSDQRTPDLARLTPLDSSDVSVFMIMWSAS